MLSKIKVIFLISLLYPGICTAQDDPKQCLDVRNISPSELPFHAGEKLTIVASYKWGVVNTDVGTITLSLSDGINGSQPQFTARARIQTARFFNTFFKVDDYYESRFSKINIRPYYFMRDIHEGKYSIQNYYNYRPDYTIEAKIVRKDGSVQDTLLPGRICTFDFMSLVYFLRTMDFSSMKPGDIYPISIAIDEEIFELYLRYEGKSEIKIPGAGTFRCLKFAAQTVAGVVFDGKEDMLFWLSDDRNRIPLYLESPVVIGRVTGRLGTYENLRFPLTSKIK